MNKRLKKLIDRIDREIKQLNFSTQPANLYEPIRYILDLGGKRIRPLLAILSYRLYQDNPDNIIQPALAIELFHNFTLMHDDIMDKAPLRRGKPTVHYRWNENIAILSGDVMLVRVYDQLLNVENNLIRDLIGRFNKCAIRVCEGQQLDLDFEDLNFVTEEEYIGMITYKTAELLGFSLELGALVAGAPVQDIDHLKQFGINIGLGFQLMDDLLDVFPENEKFGKKIGGDIISNKKTILLIKAFELAGEKEKNELEKWISSGDYNPEQKIQAVKNIYSDSGIPGTVKALIDKYFQKGFDELEKVQVTGDKKEDLYDLAHFLMKRDL